MAAHQLRVSRWSRTRGRSRQAIRGWDPPVTPAAANALVREFATGEPDRPGWFQYAIVHTSQGRVIGDVGVRLYDNRRQAEIGYTIAATHQRHGFATEAVGRLLADLFDRARLHRVSAECDARNTASAALLLRLGFTQEGCRRAHTWAKGEWTDDLLFGLLAHDREADRP
jgi:RimJ/RimL family protein N-acetyltransferase